jgi:hypothetical protein
MAGRPCYAALCRTLIEHARHVARDGAYETAALLLCAAESASYPAVEGSAVSVRSEQRTILDALVTSAVHDVLDSLSHSTTVTDAERTLMYRPLIEHACVRIQCRREAAARQAEREGFDDHGLRRDGIDYDRHH